jgi:hypothetical protein
MNEQESLAMWKLYAAHQESICIQSTFTALFEALPHDCFVGTVDYIDYESENINLTDIFNFILHKRTSFAHERELRAVLWPPSMKASFESDGRSIIVPIDLMALIKNIYVSPDSDPTLRDIIERLARKYGLDASVNKSDANAPPTY